MSELPAIWINENGVSVRELMQWLSHFSPDAGVWIMTEPNVSNEVVELWPLNNGEDVVLESRITREKKS